MARITANLNHFDLSVNRLQRVFPHPSSERSEVNRITNLNVLMTGWHFYSLPYSVQDIIEGIVPCTIGPATIVWNIISAYEFVCQDVKANASWNRPGSDHLFRLAVMIDPNRREYCFEPDNALWLQCFHTSQPMHLHVDEWAAVLSIFSEWRIRCNILPLEIGIAAVLCLLGKVFSLAPHILPDMNVSSVIKSFYNYKDAPLSTQVKKFSEVLTSTICSAADDISRQRLRKIDTELLPLLKLFMGEKTFFRYELMELLGVNNRLRFVEQWLKPALEKKLIAPTEHSPNSPKQKYRLTTMGMEQIWAASTWSLLPRF